MSTDIIDKLREEEEEDDQSINDNTALNILLHHMFACVEELKEAGYTIDDFN